MNEVLLPRIDGEIETAETFGIGALETRRGNLPMCGLGYHTRVNGLAVRTEITQTFYNPFDQPIEATYIFPIEGTMAVVDCLMLVGDRIIRADLQERSAARRRYQDAVRQGRRAALLEENRSETFSLSVGNIPAGEAVRIRMITVGQLSVVNSVWTLRLPMVVAPRYTSGLQIPGRPTGPGIELDTDEVPDASHVTPPVLLPGSQNSVDLQLTVEIDLEASKPDSKWYEHLACSLHSVLVDGDESRCRVRLKPGNRIDRDFILRGSVDSTNLRTVARLEPVAANQRGTFAIDIVPPKKDLQADRPGRDIVFVLDRSGSMGGWKYIAAQRGVARLIDSLQEHDRFGVMVFDDEQMFFVEPKKNKSQSSYRELAMDGAGLVAATDKNRFAAIKWLNQINVNGGTEMGPAILMALDMIALDAKTNSKGSIVLITDGQITGEDYVLSRLNGIDAKRRPRIYTLGVDRAVNASVLRRLSNATGGSFELVESESQLDKSIQVLAQEIGTPVLTDIRVVSDEEHDLVMGSTDLYAQRPISIFGRTRLSDLNVRLVATDATGQPWEQEVSIRASGHAESRTLISLWGKGRVRMLEDQYAILGRDDEAARQTIVETSLEARVLSRFTAYVAVDESEVVNKTGLVNRVIQPVEIPEGWQTGRWPVIPPSLRTRIEDTPEVSVDSMFHEFRETTFDLNEEGDGMTVLCAMTPMVPMARSMPMSSKPSLSQPSSQMESLGRSAKPKRQSISHRTEPLDETESLVQRLLQAIFTEAEQRRVSGVVFYKAGDSVVVHYLIAGSMQERDRLPLRLWRTVFEFLKSLVTNWIQRADVSIGDFLRDNSLLFQSDHSSVNAMMPNQKISVRIEGDERVEILLPFEN